MADYREEFQRLFESLYIPIVGDEKRGIAEYDVAFDLESRNYKLKIQNRG